MKIIKRLFGFIICILVSVIGALIFFPSLILFGINKTNDFMDKYLLPYFDLLD